MHTQEVLVEEDEYKAGSRIVRTTRKFYIHHNGDWSGDAEVVEEDGSPTGKVIATLPGRIFEVCGRNSTINDAISALEGLMVGPNGK